MDMFPVSLTRPLDKALFYSALPEHTSENQTGLATALSGSEAFATTKKGADIKVVGTYYHRMKNGGVERVISGLVPYWHKLGYEIVLFTDYPPDEDDYELPEYVTRVAIGCSYLKSTRGDYVERGISLARLLNDYHVDCMVYHSHFSHILLYDMCVCKSLNVPFIIYEHNVFSALIRSSDARFMTMSVIAGVADGIVCLDDTSTVWWRNFNKNVHTVLNPMTFDLSAVSPAKRDNRNILFLCRLNEDAKHPHDAITIIRDLVKIMPDVKLYMVGSADSERYLDGLNKRIAKLKLEENVIMTGFTKEVEKYYEMCSVFLSCSSYEGFMLTAVEAMSYSIPIVMYELPYLHTVKNNPGIVTVEQRDTGAAVNELYKLFSDQNRLTEIGDKGRKHLEEMYRVDIGAQWSTVFHSIGSAVGEPTPETKMMCDTLIRDYYYGA
ncbi:MAG: glycosyltransferase, partial [Prevotella sp.]|nr:glycosyltransferase [Prevotella sp.]